MVTLILMHLVTLGKKARGWVVMEKETKGSQRRYTVVNEEIAY